MLVSHEVFPSRTRKRTCSAIRCSQKQGIAIELQCEVPSIPVDAVKIRQVVTNLIQNALKFSGPGTGIGITPAEQEKGAVMASGPSGGVFGDGGSGCLRGQRRDQNAQVTEVAPGPDRPQGRFIGKGLG